MELENFITEIEEKYKHQSDIVSFMSFLYYQVTKGILCTYDIFEYIEDFKTAKQIHGGSIDVEINPITDVTQSKAKVHILNKKEIIAKIFSDIIAIANTKTGIKQMFNTQIEKNDELIAQLKEFISSKIPSTYKLSTKQTNKLASILKNRIVTNTFNEYDFCTDLHYLDLKTMTFNMNLVTQLPEINTLINIIIENQPTLYNYYVNYYLLS